MKRTAPLLLIVLGVILIVTGLLMGAETDIRSFSFSSSYFGEPVGEIHHPSQGKGNEKVDFDAKNKVQLTVPLGEVLVLPSDDDKIHFDYQTHGKNWSQELYIQNEPNTLVLSLRVKNEPVVGRVPTNILYLPKKVKSLDLTVNAGETYLKNLPSLKLSLEANLGSIEIKNSHLTGDMELNMGNLELENVTLEDMTTNLSMGNMEGSVKFLGVNAIEANLGNVELELLQDPKEVYLDLDTDLGSTNAVRGGEKSSTKVELKVKANLGNVEIDHKDKMKED